MTQCKSIRKDDVKITAKDLGVAVGDRFVVLSDGDSYGFEHHSQYASVGDVVVMKYDDGSVCPLFYNINKQEEHYEYFSCLARYEKEKENAKTPIDNLYDIALEYSHSSSTKEFRFTKDSLKQFVEHIKGE